MSDNACVSAKSLQLCLTLWDSMEGSLPGSSVQGLLQARILKWVVMASSRDLLSPEIECTSPELQTEHKIVSMVEFLYKWHSVHFSLSIVSDSL